MKKLMIPVTLFVTTFFAISCKKNSDATAVVEDITAAKKENILRKEPIRVSYSKATAGSTVKWSVTPPTQVFIETQGNDAIFRFGLAGDYTITATSGLSSSSSHFYVSGARYNGADSTGGSPADTTGGGGGGGPIDTTQPCNSYVDVNLPITQATVTLNSNTDSTGQIQKEIQVNTTYQLPTSCYSFKYTNMASDSSNAYLHYVNVFGSKNDCPNAVCTQQTTTASDSQFIYAPLVGLHTFNFYKDGTLVATKTIQVN